MEKEGDFQEAPPAYYDDVGNSQSGPSFPPDTCDQPPEYVPLAQLENPQQPYPMGQQASAYYKAQPPGSSVIIRQPTEPTGPMPKDYLIFAIFVTFCCCLPCGVVAIIRASETKNRWHAGDMEGAIRNSHEARKWALISLVSGIITNVCLYSLLAIYYVFIFKQLTENLNYTD